MPTPSKQRIRLSFERAANSYDSAAELQRAVCHEMAATLSTLISSSAFTYPPTEPITVLDAGCGTGYAQAILQEQLPLASHIALDLSTGMLQQVTTSPARIAGDLEALPLASDSLSLYWSSLALQWCNLQRSLHEVKRVLRPEGYLLISTLGTETFHELRQAFQEADSYPHTLRFDAPEHVEMRAKEAGLVVQNILSYRRTLFYPDLKTLLRAIKAVGANTLGEGRRSGLMTASVFSKACAAYEKQRTPAGIPLSYEIIQLTAKAPPTSGAKY